MGMLLDVSEGERRLRAARSLMSVFRRTDRVMSGKPVFCVLNHTASPYPAWTNMKTLMVNFNFKKMGELKTNEDIVRVTGLNYHELAHVMLSPNVTIGDPLSIVVNTSDEHGMAFNILEDQRIESMMVALYPSMRHYLTATIAAYILNEESSLPTAWVLIHGRRYLGKEIRQALRDVFVDQTLVRYLAAVIDRYRRLDLITRQGRNEAAELVEKFKTLLDRVRDKMPKYEHQKASACTGSHGPEDSQASQQAAVLIAKGKDALESIKGESSDTADAEDDENQEDGGGSGKKDTAKGKGKGAGVGGSHQDLADLLDEVEGKLDELLEEAFEDSEVSDQLEAAKDAINNQAAEGGSMPRVSMASRNVPDAALNARNFGQRLERIREDLSPGWHTHQSSGRINVARAMHEPDIQTIFDHWDEGKTDDASMEMVVLADVSGSMSSHETALSDALWTIKRAADIFDVPNTTFIFSSNEEVVWKHNDRAQVNSFPRIHTGGGTEPHAALMETSRILAASKRKKKMVIILTDGEWSNALHCDQLIAEMNRAGIVTALAYLSNRRSERPSSWHDCQVRQTITSLKDFVTLADGIVRETLSK